MSSRGHEIWKKPPNGSGLIALQALGMLEVLREALRGPVELLHRRIEATKLAYADGLHYISEPGVMSTSTAQSARPRGRSHPHHPQPWYTKIHGIP